MASGRPVMLRLQEIDCRFPDDDEAIINEDGTKTNSCKQFNSRRAQSSYPDIHFEVWRWRHEYTTTISCIISDKLCSIRPMKYSEVLELDRKVRSMLPKTDCTSPDDTTYSMDALQRLIRILHTEVGEFLY